MAVAGFVLSAGVMLSAGLALGVKVRCSPWGAEVGGLRIAGRGPVERRAYRGRAKAAEVVHQDRVSSSWEKTSKKQQVSTIWGRHGKKYGQMAACRPQKRRELQSKILDNTLNRN